LGTFLAHATAKKLSYETYMPTPAEDSSDEGYSLSFSTALEHHYQNASLPEIEQHLHESNLYKAGHHSLPEIQI